VDQNTIVGGPHRLGAESSPNSRQTTQTAFASAAAPAKATELGARLKAIAERGQYITAASGAAIALKEGKEFVCRAATGSTAPDLGAYLDVKTGLTAECVRTSDILRCDNAEQDPRVDLESCRRLGIESIVVMPILRQEVLTGIFELFGSQAYCFQERDVETLKGLAKSVVALLSESDISPSVTPAKSFTEPEKAPAEQPARAPTPEKHDVVCSSCGGVIDRGTGICALCAPSFPDERVRTKFTQPPTTGVSASP
jgi:transcriptional regulator with GAF, ATPase, and Fis domain